MRCACVRIPTNLRCITTYSAKRAKSIETGEFSKLDFCSLIQ